MPVRLRQTDLPLWGLKPPASVSVSCPPPTRGSQPERELATQLHLAQLPPPARNFHFAKLWGRRWEFDFAWPQARLAVECQGGIWRRRNGRAAGAHSRPQNLERDIAKAQAAAVLGWTLLPVTPRDVTSGRALELVEQLLKRNAKP